VSQHSITFTLNGKSRTLSVEANRLLIDVLRDDCKLIGTKEGCSIGVCGSCSVLIDDKLTSACLVLAATLDGSAIRTVEGMADGDELSELQNAFVRSGGFQCGICTSGQVVAAQALLECNPHPSEDEVRAWMMGNLCRCTGYYQIVDAIVAASKAS
jgi:aerobic carbon-monoxide dehydrogenase small subunit